jgi:hypothetical protein
MQWLQNPNESNVDNLNNVRRAASRHFRKKKEYLKLKLMNSKQTVRTRISENCIVASMTLRRVTSLEIM